MVEIMWLRIWLIVIVESNWLIAIVDTGVWLILIVVWLVAIVVN